MITLVRKLYTRFSLSLVFFLFNTCRWESEIISHFDHTFDWKSEGIFGYDDFSHHRHRDDQMRERIVCVCYNYEKK